MIQPGLIFFLLLSLLGCSSTLIKSNDKIDLSLNKNLSHKKNINIEIKKEFFLWGLLPQHELLLDEELGNRGYEFVSSVQVEEKSTMKDALWTLFTFGVYYPKTYVLSGQSFIKK